MWVQVFPQFQAFDQKKEANLFFLAENGENLKTFRVPNVWLKKWLNESGFNWMQSVNSTHPYAPFMEYVPTFTINLKPFM